MTGIKRGEPMARRSKKQRRSRKRKAILAPYLRELARAKVPPGVVQQAAPLMALLIGANNKRR